MKKMNIMGFS